jgi:hypothetical protein
LLTAEQVFADPHERARYKTAALENHDPAQHTYAFELRHQPGMVVGRHFHYLAVTIARSGTFLTGTTEPPGPTAAFGPNGASSVLLQKTPDKAYDVRVSEGILLIEGVAAPQINFAKLADELMKRYAAAKTTSLQ